MIFDSTMLAAVAAEAMPLVGARLRDLWLCLPDSGGESRGLCLDFGGRALLIDTHPQRARLHLVREPPSPSNEPTPFIEAARKNLRGAKLTGIAQPGFDRALRLAFVSRDAIGEVRRYTLVAEVMDRRSNVILVDNGQVVVDALKRLPPFLNRARTVLPHQPYLPPPGPDSNPLEVTGWQTALATIQPPEGAAGSESVTGSEIAAALRRQYTGISPIFAVWLDTELARGQSAATACAAFFGKVAALSDNSTAATVLCGDQPYPFTYADSCRAVASSLSELIEDCVVRAAGSGEAETAKTTLLAHLARLEKKLAAQQADVQKSLAHAEEAENHKRQGQLLLANLPAVEAAASKGEKWVELVDDWAATSAVPGDEGGPKVRIAIEPGWPAADNAERCFNRYKRAQRLVAGAPRRQNQLAAEAERLQALRARALNATDNEELGAVAALAGLAQAPPKALSRTREQQQAARPENKLRHSEINGWTVYLGRSAIENQLLLSKIASPSDVWLHVRGRASAHVLIKAQKNKQPPTEVLQAAGRWVATAGRSDNKMQGELVEIIYTQAKWVRAVKGSPGKVTLQRFETFDVKV